jgi:hypothetical protein
MSLSSTFFVNLFFKSTIEFMRLTYRYHIFNGGFAHIFYGDGHKMCRRMKIIIFQK